MSQRQQAILVLIVAVLIAFLLSWGNGGISNQGTSGAGQWATEYSIPASI